MKKLKIRKDISCLNLAIYRHMQIIRAQNVATTIGIESIMKRKIHLVLSWNHNNIRRKNIIM